jgi:hypothetical protein
MGEQYDNIILSKTWKKLENEISQSQIISPFSPMWLISDHNEYAMHIWLVLSKLQNKYDNKKLKKKRKRV